MSFSSSQNVDALDLDRLLSAMRSMSEIFKNSKRRRIFTIQRPILEVSQSSRDWDSDERDITGVIRRWNLSEFPVTVSFEQHFQCYQTSLQALEVRLTSTDNDVSLERLHNFFSENLGCVFQIQQRSPNSFLVILFSRRVAIRTLRLFSDNPALLKIPACSGHESCGFQIKGAPIWNRRIITFSGSEMYIGSLTHFQFHRRNRYNESKMELQHYGCIQPSGLPFEVPESCRSIDKTHLMREGITAVFDLSLRTIWIHAKLRYEGKLVPFRIEVPINFLHQGQVFTATTSNQHCIVLWLRCCPRIYRSSTSVAVSSDKIWTSTDFVKSEWIRDYNPDSSVIGLGQPNNIDHPLKGLTLSNAICISSSIKTNDTMNRLRRHLARNEMTRKEQVSTLQLIHCNLAEEGEKLLKWFDWVRYAVPDVCIVMQLRQLVANGYLANPFSLVLSRRISELLLSVPYQSISWVLRQMIQKGQTSTPIYNVEKMFLNYLHKSKLVKFESHSRSKLSNVFHFSVTPFRIYIDGPFPEVTNRVVRNHPQLEDRFYRVSYYEEDQTQLYLNQTTTQFLAGRIHTIQKNGLYCFDILRPYCLLGYSPSQLRSKSAWHLRDDDSGRTLKRVWKSLGDFEKCRTPGKLSARLGQWFSTSHAITMLSHDDEVAEVEDVKCLIDFDNPDRGTFNFTDGNGFCSPEVMKEVQIKQRLNYTPSAIQIRYRGYKGMLSVFPQWFSGKMVEPVPIDKPYINRGLLKAVFRKSMRKFEVDNSSFEIVDYTRYRPFHFNRQIIYALDSIGVQFDVFDTLQTQMIIQMERCSESPKKAQEFLRAVGSTFEIWRLIYIMLECGLSLSDPFIIGVINTMRIYALRYLFSRSWIVSQHGANLYGISDETKTLKYDHGNGMPEVYLQVVLRDEDEPMRLNEFVQPGRLYKSKHCVNDYGGHKSLKIIEGPVFIAKCPVPFPGDIQLCYAVNYPSLSHYENVIVFPQQVPSRGSSINPLHPGFVDDSGPYNGFRDIPNMLSGSDLDGDQYHICWEPGVINELLQIFKSRSFPKPANFYVPTIEDSTRLSKLPGSLDSILRENFINTALNNNLQLIASNHERLGHRPEIYQSGKGMHPLCIKSAEIHSTAVDFPKTGKPAILTDDVRERDHPHFKPPHHLTTNSQVTIFHSESVIGKLYDRLRESEMTIAAKSGRAIIITDLEYVGKRSCQESRKNDTEVEGENDTLHGYQIRVSWKIPEALRQSRVNGVQVELGQMKDRNTTQPFRVTEYRFGPNEKSTEIFIPDWIVEEEGRGSQQSSYSKKTRFYIIKIAAIRQGGILTNESPPSAMIELGNGEGKLHPLLSSISPLEKEVTMLSRLSSFGHTGSLPWRLFPQSPEGRRVIPGTTLTKDFEFLINSRDSSIDLDLIHKDFMKHVNFANDLYFHYHSELSRLMNQYKQYDEIEVVSGCILIEQFMKVERDFRDRLATAFEDLKLAMLEWVQESFENLNANEKGAMASAAYIIAHRERIRASLIASKRQHRQADVFGRYKQETDDDDDNDENEDGPEFENTSENRSLKSTLKYSLSFPWILFCDILLKLKLGDSLID